MTLKDISDMTRDGHDISFDDVPLEPVHENEQSFTKEESAPAQVADRMQKALDRGRESVEEVNGVFEKYKPGFFNDSFMSAPPEAHFIFKTADGDGMMPRGRTAMMVGAGAVGKSMAAMAMALSASTTTGLWPYRDDGGTMRFLVKPYSREDNEPFRTLLIMGEEEENEVRRRLHHLGAAIGLDGNDENWKSVRQLAHKYLTIMPLAGHDLRLSQSDDQRGFASTDEPSLFAQRLARELEERPRDLVIIDPASRFMSPGAETDNYAATDFIRRVEGITKSKGSPTVLIVHHTSQSSRTGKLGGDATAARGATALTDGIRWQLNLTPVGEPLHVDGIPQLVRASFSKANYAKGRGPLTLKRSDDHGGMLVGAAKEDKELHRKAQSILTGKGGDDLFEEKIAEIKALVDGGSPTAGVAKKGRYG
jgi:hypothetical protein